MADTFGIGTKPTTGTGFRGGLDTIFGKAGLPQFNRADKSLYNIDPAKWAGMNPTDQAAATTLGGYLGSFSPGFNVNPEAYTSQAANILSNTAPGGNVKALADQVFKKLNVTAPELMSRFQGLKGLPPGLLNRLTQGSSVLFGAAA